MMLALLATRVLLALVFGVAGTAKLADFKGSRKSMVDFGVPDSLSSTFAVLLPLFELTCAIALIPVSTAWNAAVGVAVLLALFIAGISVNLARGAKPDCHCFGQLHSEPVGAKTLVRNVVFLGLAGFVVWQGPSHAGASIADIASGLTPLATAIIVFSSILAIIFLLSLWMFIHMLRQNGRLMLRLEAIEGKLGMQNPMLPGLPLNTNAPSFELASLGGAKQRSEACSKRRTQSY